VARDRTRLDECRTEKGDKEINKNEEIHLTNKTEMARIFMNLEKEINPLHQKKSITYPKKI